MKKLYVLLFLAILVFSCKKEESFKNEMVEKSQISGKVEKGPFIVGSKVTIAELDSELNPSGKLFETIIKSDDGLFELENIGLISRYVQLNVTGSYFNELSGSITKAPITMWSLVDIKDKSKVSVNPLTSMEMPRVKYLIKNDKMSFSSAKEQAKKELLACFNIFESAEDYESASITDNNKSAALLIAIASILQRNSGPEIVSEMMAKLSLDIEKDGKLDDPQIKDKIKQNSKNLTESMIKAIKSNIKKRYESLGQTVEVPDFNDYIDFDGNGIVNDDVPSSGGAESDPIPDGEKGFIEATTGMFRLFQKLNYQYNLLEALYSQSIDLGELKDGWMIDIYNRNLDQSGARSQIDELWGESYKLVANANVIIAEAARKTDPKIIYYGANTNIFRAISYLKIVNLWGDVPFPRKAGSEVPFVKKSEIINKLIDDVKGAIPLLTEEPTKFGIRFSIDMAYAVLAKLYLEDQNYGEALIYANKIIDSGKYSLYDDPSKIFSLEENVESLLLLHLGKVDYGLIKKGEYAHFVRYPEILLIAAECYMRETTPNKEKAIEKINPLRSRNKHTALTLQDSEKLVLDAILEEWKYDLKQEGFVFATMKRFGLVPAAEQLFPIPDGEIQ